MNFWPVYPSTTFISTSTEHGAALTFAPPWPAVVTNESDIAIVQECLSDFLTTEVTVTTPDFTGLGTIGYALNSTMVLA